MALTNSWQQKLVCDGIYQIIDPKSGFWTNHVCWLNCVASSWWQFFFIWVTRKWQMVAVKSKYTWRCRTAGAFNGLEGSEMRQVLINHSAGGRRWGLFCISSVCFFLGFFFSWQEVPRAYQQLKEELHSFSRDSSIPPFVPRRCLFERPSSP